MVNRALVGFGAGLGASVLLLASGITLGAMAYNNYPENKYLLSNPDAYTASQYEEINNSLDSLVKGMDEYILIDDEGVMIITKPDNETIKTNLKYSIGKMKDLKDQNKYARRLVDVYMELEILDNDYPFYTDLDDVANKSEYGSKYLDIKNDLDFILNDIKLYVYGLEPHLGQIYRDINAFNKAADIVSIIGYTIGSVGTISLGLFFGASLAEELPFRARRRKNRP